jgi:glycosyltransferase involved in cell wall biosynthesis
VLVAHPGAELYGADRVLLESVAALAGRFDVTVALPGPGPLIVELETLGVRVVQCPMPVLRNEALRPRGAARLLADGVRGVVPALRLLRRHGSAGVYVNTLTLPSWPLLARLARRASLCHVHEAEQSAPRILRRGMALCPALSDRVMANSRFTLDVLTDVAPRLGRRSTVVHNAVRGPAEVAPARPELVGPLRLLFVGRLSPRKGPQVAVATLRELVDRGLDARLTLLGSVFEGYEWFEAQLRETVTSAGLDDRVDLLGFQPDVWPHLADADVVLVPSVGDESFGNAAVEAVLAARPLVVSNHSGLREATAGYAAAQAVDPARPADWADAVERVAADWGTFRESAMQDSRTARLRHAPSRYREQLVEQVASLTRGRAPTLADEATSAPEPVRSGR